MLYQGTNISVSLLSDGIAEFIFANQGSVNKFDKVTFKEFREALVTIKACTEVKGLLISSAKSSFIVGADINEFLPTFSLAETALIDWIKAATDTFDELEDLPFPTVVAINGFALGGGCEFILSCDYRIADTSASIGLPEVKLGIMPGFGGTVRLPRVIGVDNAVEWISTGRSHNAEQALKVGAIDAAVKPEHLRAAAITTLKEAIHGKLDWQAKRAPKLHAIRLSAIESIMSFSTCKGMIMAKAGKHYPAPVVMIETMEAAASLDRAGAMELENKNFAVLAKSNEAQALVGIFLADQVVKSKAKMAVKLAQENDLNIAKSAVLGAGIMGGGIAYQSAYKGIPIVMKDIRQEALDLGLTTATNILTKLQQRGRITVDKLANVLTKITPSLSYDAILDCDVIVEAVVENQGIKQSVLQEVEAKVPADTILTSNTSTISIDALAENLTRKDKFCGMHFFNPVHRMPLVEVIRGAKTSDETIAAVVSYASNMGKSAIVVNDCPGFYVNRVLFPYFAAFSQLVLDGADFAKIDQVMEQEFGWPMGPAMLLDVVGIDTAAHCADVMAQGYPSRMQKIANDPVTLLFKQRLLGQKTGTGFYQHSKDKRGRPIKQPSQEALTLIAEVAEDQQAFSDDAIIHRLMIPMINEVIRCLEEGIVDSAFEADMALINGLGFPPFRGGAIRYLETIGLEQFIDEADKLADLGEIYQVTSGIRAMAKNKQSYFEHKVTPKNAINEGEKA